MDEQLNETKTEEKGGSVVLPTVIGAGAGYIAKKTYDSGANKLVASALEVGEKDAKAAPDALKTAANKIVDGNAKLADTLHASQALKADGAIAGATSVTIEKAAGEGAKGFTVKVGEQAIHGVDKLKGEAKALLPEGKTIATIEGDAVKKLTEGGAKSWLGRTAAKAEEGVYKAIRGDKAWKDAGGGIKATFSHMSTGGKVGLVAASAVAAIGLGTGVKNLFTSHTSRVEADRATPATGKSV